MITFMVYETKKWAFIIAFKYLNCIASFGFWFFLPIFLNMVQGRFLFQFQVGMSILSDLAKHVEHQSALYLTWVIKYCQTPCQITKCGCKINNLTIFSIFLFSSKYLNFEWFGQTCRASECSKLDLRDECCPFRRRSKVAENGLVQGRKSKYP